MSIFNQIGKRMAAKKETKNAHKKQVEEMNALALRIWEGQGSVPLIERVRRIVRGLEGQGYTDLSGLSLPDPDFKRYL